MKKTMALILACVLALALVACGGSSYKDGTYTAQASAANHGWTDTLSVTYKDGKVTAATYDAFADDGSLKSETTAETYPMDPHPTVWIPQLNENILAAGKSDSVEAVAGATNSSNSAKLLMAAIEKAAQKGDTNTVMVDLPAEV